jgi:hypothetical protein
MLVAGFVQLGLGARTLLIGENKMISISRQVDESDKKKMRSKSHSLGVA